MTSNEWISRAQCAGDDLQKYDLNQWRDDKSARARDLCKGCPVMAECAADALNYPAWGTVRAGIWMPDRDVAAHRRHLQLYHELLEEMAAPVIYKKEKSA